MNYSQALENCIFRYISGSHAYGTERPDSDKDIRGVFIAPIKYAFDLFQSSYVTTTVYGNLLLDIVHLIDNGEYQAAREKARQSMSPEQGDLNISVATVHNPGADDEMHELRRFLKLATDSNPNIVEYLYVDRLILHETPIWKRITNKRDMFLSKKARYTFSGYAHAQLKRIMVHRGYLLNPPSHKPVRSEFGLPEDTQIIKEHQNAILSLPEKWLKEEAREYVLKEKEYRKVLEHYNSYMKWDRERNKSRKELEAKYGFDVKHAMHLVRLCRMGVEIIKHGVVNVYRPDREELKGILRGKMKYEDLLNIAADTDNELEKIYESSPLRHKPDHKGISDLYISICEEHYGVKFIH